MREDLPLLFAFKLKLLLDSRYRLHAAMSRAYGCPDRCRHMSGTGERAPINCLEGARQLT